MMMRAHVRLVPERKRKSDDELREEVRIRRKGKEGEGKAG